MQQSILQALFRKKPPMPVTRLTCPHCEQNVEVSVTSVTRSRECPKCGKTIILQFTTKESRVKRKALLMPAETHDDAASVHTAPEAPRVLEGDIHRRMLHDPEVQSSARRLAWGASIVGGLIVIMVLGHYLKWWPSLTHAIADTADRLEGRSKTVEPGNIPFPAIPAPKAEVTELPKPKPRVLSAKEEGKQKVVVAIQNFLNAPTVDERAKVVLDRAVVEPKMKLYYASHKDGPVAFDRLDLVDSDATGDSFAYDVLLSDGGRRRIAAEKLDTGEYAVDWPSFVVFSDMEWKALMEQRPKTPVLMRVLVSVDDYYNNSFNDPRALGCLRIVDPNGVDSPPIFAYYGRSTTLGREVEFVMRRFFGAAVPMVLALKYPEDGQGNNQVWVDELLAEGWVLRGR